MIVSLVLCARPVAYAQEGGFSISPADFTVKDVPLLGELYRLERKLVIRNTDNIKRTFNLRVLTPENLTPGYEAIPEPSWVAPIPQVIEVKENSWGEVEIWVNIPRQENLTSQRWEAWISVRRQAEIGEVLEPELICKARIETTAELPPGQPPAALPTILTIHPASFTLQVGKAIILTATLTQNGNPVVGETIIWNASAGGFTNRYTLTDSSGQAKATYVAPEYEIPVTVTASYFGGVQYSASSANLQGTIIPPPARISEGLIVAIAIVIGCAIIGVAVLLTRLR